MATLHVHLGPLRSNLDRIGEFCRERNLDFLPVTKVIQSRPGILAALAHPSLRRIADIHWRNLAALEPTVHADRAILRPLFAEAERQAGHATRVFLSNPALALHLARARVNLRLGTPLRVMVMVEAGDLRDGVPWDELPGVVRTLAAEPGLEVAGLAANFGCLAGVVPDCACLDRMAESLKKARRLTGHPLPAFSIGGTVVWDLLREHRSPPEFTELRLGEAVFFGWNTTLDRNIPELSSDVFSMDLEVLEVWDKFVPQEPEGPTGLNAFGERPVQIFTGRRRRAVLDGGENLAPARALIPQAPGIVPVGATHEYTVADCTDAAEPAVPGTTMSFRPRYEAIVRCFLSPHLNLVVGE